MRKFLLFLIPLAWTMGCKINKKPSTATEKIILEDVVVRPPVPAKDAIPYQAMEPRVIDLLHTELHLSFDYPRQWVFGEAILRLKPYAQSLRRFELDAHHFDLLKVARIQGKDTQTLSYTYDTSKITISLASELKVTDTLKLYIKYIAKPGEIDAGGGRAITDTKGLYFINPLGTDPNKPRQIWSQGETEYNSGWFPTVDAPNEKHTQDLYLLLDSGEVSLSNGLLIGSEKLKNGLHIDHWQQLKPHAPYLTMIAIGNFMVTKDTWRGKEVSYYLEPAYAPYARTIFGKTPQMIEAFSQITGVPYPWDKFSQVVCHDFVSGAMENTTAVLHHEGVQHTTREHIDQNQDAIIVHELFHQWFGDYVTCRSWSHLPLNESFATYGEYLYNEYTYGADYADQIFANNLQSYLRSKSKYRVSPIRNYYENSDEVFDVVSYQKGSWILHQMRNEVGDSAFFKGMNRYLTQNAYGTADIHQLRMAMEWACGRDLIPFFKQWYEGFGHPDLKVWVSNEKPNEITLKVQQIQDSSFVRFQLHTSLTCVFRKSNENAQVISFPIYISQGFETFPIAIPQGYAYSDLISWWIDEKGCIPGTFMEMKSNEAWLNMLKYTSHYQPRRRAMQVLSGLSNESMPQQKEMIEWCLGRTEPYYKVNGMDLIEKLDTFYLLFEKEIMSLATISPDASVRDEAIYLLGYKGKPEVVKSYLLTALNDSSYNVIATALQALAIHDKDLALQKCTELESLHTASVQRAIAWLYAAHATTNKNEYYKGILGKYGNQRNSLLTAYGNYLRKQAGNVVVEGLENMEVWYLSSSDKNKAFTMNGVLKNLENNAVANAVFSTETFLRFKKRVVADLELR